MNIVAQTESELIYNELQNIEAQLTTIITTNKKAWVEIYKLLKIIETRELWRITSYTFTGWLKSFSERNKISISLLWRIKQAGKFYEEFQNRNTDKDIPNLSNVKLPVESLNLIERIAGSNEEIADNMMNRLLNKEISIKDLRSAWETTKAERKLATPPTHDLTKEEKIQLAHQISAKDIAIALSNANWIPKEIIPTQQFYNTNFKFKENKNKYYLVTDFPLQTKHNKIHRLSLMCAETHTISSTEKATNLHLHAITIITEKGFDTSIFEITKLYADFSWIAVPYTLENSIIDFLPDYYGLISMQSDQKTLKIIKIPKISNYSERINYKLQALCTFINKLQK